MKRDLGIIFGKRLRELREAKFLTQAQLAGALLKSIETISNFERGKTLPGLRTVEQLAEVLGVEMRELFAFEAGSPNSGAESLGIGLARKVAKMSAAERALIVDFVDLLARHRIEKTSKR